MICVTALAQRERPKNQTRPKDVDNGDYHHLSQNETNLVYLAARRKRHRPVAGLSEDFNKTFEEAFSAGCDPRGFGQARQDGPLLSYYR
jgi:hypothetical protein